MLTLGQKQRALLPLVARLSDFAYYHGYEVTLGDGYRDPRLHGAVGEKKGYGHSKSGHKLRLAIDLNLFKDSVYLTSTEDHRILGEYWESLGTPEIVTCWGGRFQDGNHYSIEHGGVK